MDSADFWYNLLCYYWVWVSFHFYWDVNINHLGSHCAVLLKSMTQGPQSLTTKQVTLGRCSCIGCQAKRGSELNWMERGGRKRGLCLPLLTAKASVLSRHPGGSLDCSSSPCLVHLLTSSSSRVPSLPFFDSHTHMHTLCVFSYECLEGGGGFYCPVCSPLFLFIFSFILPTTFVSKQTAATFAQIETGSGQRSSP